MDAGQFDRRITLQRKVTADDGYTTGVTGYIDLATVWAKLIPLPSGERLEAGEIAATRNVRYKIRRDSSWSDLNESDRFMADELPHDITRVASETGADGRRFFLVDGAYRGDQN